MGGIAGAMHEAGSKAAQPFARITAHATQRWAPALGPLVGCQAGELARKRQPDRQSMNKIPAHNSLPDSPVTLKAPMQVSSRVESTDACNTSMKTLHRPSIRPDGFCKFMQ